MLRLKSSLPLLVFAALGSASALAGDLTPGCAEYIDSIQKRGEARGEQPRDPSEVQKDLDALSGACGTDFRIPQCVKDIDPAQCMRKFWGLFNAGA